MTMLTLGQAARLCGRGKTTLARAIKRGTLSASRNDSGGYIIDPSELSRVFPISAPGDATRRNGHDTEAAAHRATAELRERAVVAELELSLLREQLADLRRDRDDTRTDRDHWRTIAEDRLTLLVDARPQPAQQRPWWKRLAG